MDKDFDYNNFVEFMQSLGGTEAFYNHSNDPTQNIINEINELEKLVATRPSYNSAEDMMNSIRGM
jgi:hypothetical protein|tara:strand:- start:500 stop:694 length:195 start_codon:yes stop_codon:yes gene_type:complete